jgi:hypothetical protein
VDFFILSFTQAINVPGSVLGKVILGMVCSGHSHSRQLFFQAWLVLGIVVIVIVILGMVVLDMVGAP